MIKNLCALSLVILLSGNSLVLAQENWVFTAADKVNSNQNQNYYNDTYYGYAQTADRVYNYSNTNYANRVNTTYTPSNYTTQTYQPTTYSSSSTSYNNSTAAQKETFSDNHPILAALGWGTLALGVTAVGWLLEDDDDKDKCHKNHDKKCPPPPPDKHHRK